MEWWNTRWWDEIGCCTVCGCDDTKVKMVDEATWVCEECLERDYFYCDGCEQFWECDALEITEALVRSGAIDVIVVDSVAALVPRAEIEGEMGDSYVGLHARLMSQALRKLTGAIGKTNTIVIFINQLREKVGVMYGNPETTPGGRALKFFASVRIDIRKSEQLKDGNDIYGNRVRCKVVKNKVAPPFKVVEVDLIFGKGVSHEGELLDMASNLEVVQKSGAWFSYNGERLGQGRENVKELLVNNKELANEIEAKVREKL